MIRKFDYVDLAEWTSIVEKEVERILSESEAREVSKKEPGRIMGSRFVRTRKYLDF